jgi:Methylamine utilisation protein MauE
VVAGVLVIAAVQKLRSGTELRGQLAAFGVPARLAPTLAVALPVAELAVGVSLVAVPYSSVPGWCAVALLAAFTGVIAVNLARGHRAPCPCFGASSAQALSPVTIARNGWLLALAVLATGPVSGANALAVVLWTAGLAVVTMGALRTLA